MGHVETGKVGNLDYVTQRPLMKCMAWGTVFWACALAIGCLFSILKSNSPKDQITDYSVSQPQHHLKSIIDPLPCPPKVFL